MDLNEFMAQSNARAKRGRALGRMMIFGVIVVLAFSAFLWIAAPNFTAMSLYEPRALEVALPFVGVAGLVIGLIWMVRIFRADPEPEHKGWRYRDS